MPESYLKHIEKLSKEVGHLLSFKDKLIEGLTTTFVEAKKVISPTAINLRNNIVQEEQFKVSNVDFTAPSEALSGAIYNITNNVTITNIFDIITEPQCLVSLCLKS